MFAQWIFLAGVISTSDTLFLMSGMTAALKTYTDHFPWFIPDGNSTSSEEVMAPSRFQINTEKPKTLREYLQEHANDDNANQEIYPGKWNDSQVVVVARIGDYDKEAEADWKIIAEPKIRNDTLNNNEENKSGNNNTESGDYFFGNDDVQKYLSDYQDLLYTFKDFVNIGANPAIKQNISSNYEWNLNNGKTFNVTYVMPIPKTKKYFEIKLSNLTKTQYNEINALLQEQLLRKKNSTEISKNKEHETVYVDVNTRSNNNIISQAFSNPLSSQNWNSKNEPQNNSLTKDWPIEHSENYFEKLLTSEGFDYFIKNYDSLPLLKQDKTNEQPVSQTNKLPPSVLQNNGFHAEIATDYVKKQDEDVESNAQGQAKESPQDLSSINEQLGATEKPTFNSNLRRNRTKLFPQTRSKRPIMNVPNDIFNRRRIKNPYTGSDNGETTSVSTHLDPESSISNLESKNINTPSKPEEEKFQEVSSIDTYQMPTTEKYNTSIERASSSSISFKELTNMYELYDSSSTTSPSLTPNSILNITSDTRIPGHITDQPKSVNVMEAAKWLIDMKKKIEEEERKKTERYKNYIKQFLGGDEGSILSGRGEDGNIMKINKQENILEELKLLMLDYFASLNFKNQEVNSSSSAVSSILNATNIFELMEQSSQLVKQNLQRKIHAETKEPTGFVKRIVEKQVEKCKRIFNSSKLTGAKPDLLLKNRNKRFMVFTKCMNFKLKRCIRGFSVWLEKGKFYLRPQFKLDRAYENYEIERNLYCLRNYNPASLGSNPHGVRIKPRPKINRKTGTGMVKGRSDKIRFRMRKLKSGQNKELTAKRNMERNRRYKQEHIIKPKPNVQRYSDQPKEVTIKRQNSEIKEQ